MASGNFVITKSNSNIRESTDPKMTLITIDGDYAEKNSLDFTNSPTPPDHFPYLSSTQNHNDHTHHHHHHHHHHLLLKTICEQKQKYAEDVDQLHYDFVSQSSSKPCLRSIQKSSLLVHLKLITIAALPYLVFLTCFALNAYLRILPTADDVNRVAIYNVSVWESYIPPCSVDRVIASFSHRWLDLLAAFPYLAHYFLPLVYPVYLYFVGRSDLVPCFYQLLGWTMWVHYAIWFCVPTFPPWAVASFFSDGKGNDNHTPALDLSQKEGRAFARVDRFLHWPLFHNLFSGNPVPFASFPSGHVAWPTCIFLTLPPGGSVTFAFYIALMSWATMYSDHHYMLDAVVAIVVVALTQKLIACVNKTNQDTNGMIV